MQNPNDDEIDDPLIESLLDKAMAGYEGVLPQPELAAIRSCLRDDFLFTPQGQRALRRLRADATVDQSGAVRKDGAPVVEITSKKKRA